MSAIRLCNNCLRDGAVPVNVGPQKGPQMDTYYDTLDLCAECKEALLEGDLGTFSHRYSETRTIERKTIGGLYGGRDK